MGSDDERGVFIIESLLLQLSGLVHWKIALIATGTLLEGAIFTVFPEEVVITTLGVLWSQHRIGFVEALVAVQCGLLPANLILVFLGNRLGTKLFGIPPFRWFLKPEAVARSLEKLRSAGNWVVFGTRFIPLIRGPVYFATGLSKFPSLRFFRIDFLASFIQIPLLLWLGATIGKNSSSILQAYQRVGGFMVALIGLMAVISLAKSRVETSRVLDKSSASALN
jgi:membrane protein DedA with SNARE-associated domain